MLRPLALIVALASAIPAAAQDRARTLADIRQELTVLYVDIQRLKRELSTTGTPNPNIGGTSALERIDSVERALTELTAKTEDLENRIDRIVRDGTNRIGDLEFRLVELEGGDVSQLGETTTLGGGELPGSATSVAPVAVPDEGPLLAVGEQRDFDKAKSAYDSGSYEVAANQFQSFSETYLGGPLAAEAHFWRGRSLAALGNPSAAARAYLASYSGNPEGTKAPDALLELGRSLDTLGQVDEACKMLVQVEERYPGTAAASEAAAEFDEVGCE